MVLWNLLYKTVLQTTIGMHSYEGYGLDNGVRYSQHYTQASAFAKIFYTSTNVEM